MDIYTQLHERFPTLQLERDFSFARHTTLGCGGSAAVAAYPASFAQAEQLFTFLCRAKIPHFFMGAGANLLPCDGVYEGVLVRFSRLNFLSARGEIISAGAGITGGKLCRFARECSLGGLEPFTGIPMTVGGATAMNAGIREGHFSDFITNVFAVENGKLRIFPVERCEFSQKSSIFLQGVAVLGVVLRVKYSSREEILRKTCYFKQKRSNLPKGRSMGCTFVNPAHITAGALIERCGLKGARMGGAVVSSEHANFIINEGGSASDVSNLITYVKEVVLRLTGISLREEIRRIPLS